MVVENVDTGFCEFVIGIECIVVRVTRLCMRIRTCEKSMSTFEVKMVVLKTRKQEGIRMDEDSLVWIRALVLITMLQVDQEVEWSIVSSDGEIMHCFNGTRKL